MRDSLSSILAAAAMLCGCTAEPPDDRTQPASNDAAVAPDTMVMDPPRDPDPSASPALAIGSEGLRLVDPASGRTAALAFDTGRDAVLKALAFRGPPGIGTNSECGAGPLDQASWPDGLTLYFQDGAFVGWALDGRGAGGVTTMAGLGIGSTRADLESAYAATVEKTTLGQEFAAGELFGILDGDGVSAKVSNLWAGTSCNFR